MNHNKLGSAETPAIIPVLALGELAVGYEAPIIAEVGEVNDTLGGTKYNWDGPNQSLMN